MQVPEELRYHPEDTWARDEGEGRVRVGITDFAQDQLGDIVFVDMPQPGTEVVFGESFGVIESTKTVADLHAPVSGRVVEINEQVERRPELVNEEPYGAGWIILVEASAELGGELLDAETYRRSTEHAE
jgi:glycine cleavage system H protein